MNNIGKFFLNAKNTNICLNVIKIYNVSENNTSENISI